MAEEPRNDREDAARLPPIAMLTSRYPALSETFVWREVLALTRAGWRVVGVSMHEPEKQAAGLSELPRAQIVLRERGMSGLLGAALVEMLRHPLLSARTLLRACWDSLLPGEPTTAGRRARNLLHAATGLAAAHRLRPLGIEHIHCHFAHAPAGVGMYAALQLGVGFSFVGHATDLFADRVLLRRKLERAAFVSCISGWHRDWFRQQAPEAATPLPVVRCGVPIEGATPRHPSAEPAQRLRVLSVARLVPKKGLDLLIAGLVRAGNDHGLDWSLRIAGDGPERASLTALAERSGAENRVTMLGAVAPSEVQDLLADADLFALPCRVDPTGDRDGIPVALMEAMASGVPVVAGDLPTLRELVVDERTGVLCPMEDLDALVEILVSLARDPERRAALGRAGREHVIAEFAMDANAQRLGAALREALGRSERPTPEAP